MRALDEVVQPRPRPDPALLPDHIQATLRTNFFQTGADGAAARAALAQARPVGDPRPARAAAEVRDLRLLAAGRGRAPALRRGRARRPALVGPARRLPHRGPRPGQGADGEEHRDRAGRRQGRLLRQAAARPERTATRWMAEGVACYKTFISGLLDITDNLVDGPTGARSCRRATVVRHDGDDTYLVVAADKGTATFSDIANGISPGLRLLARRRVRLRRLGRLRPQGDGHHRARRLGVGTPPLPRDGRRLPERGLHLRRHRRHVRRRVRQRDALLRAHPAGRGLRPPRHLHRPEPRRGHVVRRAQAALRPAALVVAGLRHLADLRGRRRLPAQRQVDPDQPADARGARPRGHRRTAG